MSKWEEYKKKQEKQARPWDLINPKTEWAEEELATERFSLCSGCPELINLTKQCKKCGCFMPGKTKIKHAACPLGKW